GLRHHRLGQSAFDPRPMELHGATTGVLSPDAGDLPLLSLLGSARATIEVGVYTFQSERIASVLAAAAEREVHVRVLLDGSPVGGVEEDEHRVVGGLLAAGVEVRWLGGGPDIVKRYRYLHAKYAIVDAPDTSRDPEGILDFFASAKGRLSIDAFYLDELWRDTPNPFLEAAFTAARRGVSVRILLDGSWASVEADSGTNDDVLERINRRATNESVPLEVRLLKPRGPIERLHNKGAVVDGRAVLVSSMNWALGSATENREVGLIV